MTTKATSDEDVCFTEPTSAPDGVRKATEGNPRLLGLPVDLHVLLGGARLSFAELVDLGEDAVIKLDRDIDDPVDLAIGDRIFARGALIESEGGGLSVRITEVIDDAA